MPDDFSDDLTNTSDQEGQGLAENLGEGADGSSPSQDQLSPELLKQLEGLSLDKLPENHPLRRSVLERERNLQADYTRKTQALAEEKGRIYDTMIQRLAQQGVNPTPDQREALKERIRQGDFDSVGELVSQEIQTRLAPTMQKLTMQQVLQEAASMHPYVQTKASEVAALIQSDPRYAKMASMNDMEFAPVVLAQAAMAIERQELIQAAKAKDAEIAKLKKSLEAQDSAIGRRLPPSTSRTGGATATRTKGGENFWEAATAAAQELGIDLGPHVPRPR